MECVRCHKEFDSYAPEVNAENYGGYVKYACPHCGKLYVWRRVVQCRPLEDEEIYIEEDGWGHRVVKDADYKSE